MELELVFFATFREAVGEKTIRREYDDDATVGEVLAALEAEFPDLAGELLEDDEIPGPLSVLVNGRDVAHEDGTDTTLEAGDRVSVFPPVAGGTERRTEAFRGISARLALRYLENLGGERVADDRVAGDGWTADVSAETVPVGSAGSLELTEVTVVFEGEGATLDEVVEAFSRKAMRAGG